MKGHEKWLDVTEGLLHFWRWMIVPNLLEYPVDVEVHIEYIECTLTLWLQCSSWWRGFSGVYVGQ